ncbi:zinc ABC transporter substrate-binding protein AztC [Sinosporangium siamense]|uniref:ABC transporter substrate-binding protein n=1 Tax=Sinosporangium siamense TaxID=1367973 RepID=A0A919V4D0_9ACTN|nr:zinc ABC transporter substrate-binding protein AztC [Sinosporangium siamense]GII90408.1 ABC transporter substrate-binding protein [Sinosporangium siamense]
MRTQRWTALLTAAVIAGFAVLAGCASGRETRAEIVVTTNILGDVTREIVGGQAEVTVLMKPDSDPHSFGVSAQQAARLSRAALVVHNGLGLEEGVLRHVEAAKETGAAVLAVGEAADPIVYAAGAGDETAGRPDPHFWTDPRRMARAVGAIARHVVESVPGVDAEAIRRNAAAYRGKVEKLDAWMEAEFAAIPAGRRNLVTNHHVFGYFAERFSFKVVGTVIPSGTTLASPSASDLKSLVDAVRAAGVRTIFADSSHPDRLAKVLAAEAGLDVAVVPLFTESLSTARKGASTYLDMMRSNTTAMVNGLVEKSARAQ